MLEKKSQVVFVLIPRGLEVTSCSRETWKIRKRRVHQNVYNDQPGKEGTDVEKVLAHSVDGEVLHYYVRRNQYTVHKFKIFLRNATVQCVKFTTAPPRMQPVQR